MFEILKFAWVALCFLTACASYFKCAEKRDWLFLTIGLGITLWADYFLILKNNQIFGVLVFCFAHVAYIMRVSDSQHRFYRWVRLFLPVSVLAILYLIAFLPVPIPLAVAFSAVYAVLFAVNIILHFRWFKNNTRLPRRNVTLALAGILLFALCDINVMVYNLQGSRVAYYLLWVFYLPAQALLAVSAVGLGGFSKKQPQS